MASARLYSFTSAAARISDCGKYRYALERSWSRDPRYMMFIMLNPSTADASKEDPTIRRCLGFASIHGFDGILVGNLYAYRTPKPAALRAAWRDRVDIVGPQNDRYLTAMAARAEVIVCAWGQCGPLVGRMGDVQHLIGKPMHCFGYTKYNLPRHPLMLPKKAPLEVYA